LKRYCTPSFRTKPTADGHNHPRRKARNPMTDHRSPWLDEDLDAFRELARSFCAKELTPHQQRWRAQHHVDRSLWKSAASVGLLCLSVPEEYGGGGGTFAHEAVLLEEQARTGDSA